MKFYKGVTMVICENGEITNFMTNMDCDRELKLGETFTWHANKSYSIEYKLVQESFPLYVEEVV